MIKLININIMGTKIEVSFTPEVKTYNIITGFMSDECKAYRVAQSAMIWLSESGELGELECIYPMIVDAPLCRYSDNIIQKDGFPQFKITSCDNDAYIQQSDNQLIVWLKKDKIIDMKVNFENLKFLISGNELVAIIASQITIVG